MENNNKKTMLIGGAVLLAAVAFMFGSSSGTTNNTNPNPQVTQDTYTPEPPTYTNEDLFLQVVNGQGNSVIANIADSDLVDMGYQVCDVLDEGYTIDDIVNEFVYNSSLSTDAEFEAVGLIIGAAVKHFCPQYVSMVEGYLS